MKAKGIHNVNIRFIEPYNMTNLYSVYTIFIRNKMLFQIDRANKEKKGK